MNFFGKLKKNPNLKKYFFFCLGEGGDQGEITQKVCKQELLFLYVTHHHDLFYITVKYHDYIQNGFQVTEQT